MKENKILYYTKLEKGGYDCIININGHDISNFYYALDYKDLRRDYKGFKLVKVEV